MAILTCHYTPTPSFSAKELVKIIHSPAEYTTISDWDTALAMRNRELQMLCDNKFHFSIDSISTKGENMPVPAPLTNSVEALSAEISKLKEENRILWGVLFSGVSR